MRRLLLLFFLFAGSAYAQGTFSPSTCQQGDVNAAINGTTPTTPGSPQHIAVNGDTINIPSGSCAWSSGINIGTVGITIQGNGTPNASASVFGASASCSNTTITVSGTTTAFAASPAFGSPLMHLSCMNLTYGSGAVKGFSILGHCSASDCTKLRMDNITFTNWTGHSNLAGISAGIGAIGDMFGVIDHNTINGTPSPPAPSNSFLQFVEFSNAHFLSTTASFGDSSWATAENYGSANYLFFENNILNSAGLSENEGSAGGAADQGGGRIVGRFNQFNIFSTDDFAMGWHGTESSGRPRSTRSFEFYKNQYVCGSATVTGHCQILVDNRGGTGLIWGNSITMPNNGTISGVYTFATTRSSGNPGAAAWGSACDGGSPYDLNDPSSPYVTGLTIQSISGSVVTVSPNPGWTTNQWVGATGQPFSMHDVTANNGTEITASGSNTLTLTLASGPAAYAPTVGHSVQVTRAFACIDQAGGRGQGFLYNAGSNPAAPAQSSAQAVSPSYEWLDNLAKMPIFGTLPIGTGSTGTIRSIALRDWYQENFNQATQTSPTSPFDGTKTTNCGTTLGGTNASGQSASSGPCGIGHGIFANRPATCTTGVGYWATDVGNWNTTVAANTSGLFYLCTATNVWTLSYTPFTYPHPLITGASGTPTASLSATSVAFGNVAVNTAASPQTVTLTNTGTANLIITNMTISPSVFTFSTNFGTNCGGTITPGNNCIITFNFTPTAVTSYSGSFVLTTNDPVGPHTVTLTGAGSTPTASFSPVSPLNIGSVPVGLTSNNSRLVTLTNTGTVNLIVRSITVGDFEVTVLNNTCGASGTITSSSPGAGFTLGVGSSCQFQATVLPANTGFMLTGVTFFDNTVTGNDIYTVEWTGSIPPAPSSAPFGK